MFRGKANETVNCPISELNISLISPLSTKYMKTLKQKWIDFLPASMAILGIVLSAYLIVYGIHVISKPDTRTIDQIIQEKLKDCIKYSSPSEVPKCFDDLSLPPNH